jgi:ATP-binding cassette subfamily F protein uup
MLSTTRVESVCEREAEGLTTSPVHHRLGNWQVMILKEAAVETDAARGPIIENLSWEFSPGDRIGVVGPNGAGKSTLLDMLVGRQPLAAGSRELGETITFGFLEQEPPAIPTDIKMIDYLQRFVSNAGPVEGGDGAWGNLRPDIVLERVGFVRSKQQQLCTNLSGGERRRLHLAQVLLSRPNFLILDEPTNDLDLQTIEVLEDFLASYSGCLMVVSHDRAFMDNTVDSLFVLEGDGAVRGFDGSYTEYLAVLETRVKEEEAAAAAAATAAAATAAMEAAVAAKPTAPGAVAAASKPKVKKLSWRETQEYEKLEGEIDTLSERRDTVSAELAKGGDDYDAMMKLTDELAELMEEIDLKSDRWMELAERVDA